MKRRINKKSRRICAFVLSVVLVLTSFMGSLITQNNAKASEDVSSDVIINNFDETDVTYTNTEGWFSNAMTFSAKRDANSELCVDHASVEDGVGADGSKGARFWQIRSSSSNDQNVSYVRLYDTAENDYRMFTPEANTTYIVSLKMKAVTSGKNIYVQLRNAADDGTIAYNDTVVASLNDEAIMASADADWQELKIEFTTGDTVAPLYIALKSHDAWWAIDAEVYVDDITVSKKIYTPSDQIINNFDEADVTYTNTEGWYSNAMTFSAKRDANSKLCADHASVEEGVGVDGSKGTRFWQIRSSSSNDQSVSYVRLYDTAENDYRMFTPETNTKYTVSLKIKAVTSGKNIYVQLRNATEDGTIAYTDTVVASLNDEVIVASADAEWQELKVEFTTGDTVAPLYIALKSHDAWWATDAEVYVDDICVAKKVNTSSNQIINDFDETDVTYTNTEGWYSNAMTFSAKRDDNSELCLDHASVEEGVGVDGSKGARFWQIRSSSSNDQSVSYVRLYDTAENNYRMFTPKANTTYTISLRMKAVTSSKNVYVQLRSASADGIIAYDDAVIADLNSKAIVASTDADWQELTATFTTGDAVAPLYIALKSHDTWWATGAEVYVDDICVIEKVYIPESQIINHFDETDVTYTNTEGWFSNAMTFSAKRDDNSELCLDHASVEEGVGVDGSKGARFWQIRGSSSNDQFVSYIRLYDTARNDYRMFTPEVNRKYAVSLKIKAVTSDLNLYVQLRSAATDGTIAYNDIVVANLNDEAIVASADADWQELTVEFTTGDTVAPLYIALKGDNAWWATGAEVYVDDIEIMKSEELPVQVINYDGEDKVVYTLPDVIFSEFKTPIRSGYKFCGWYSNEAKTIPVSDDAIVVDYEKIWVKWELEKFSGDENGLQNHLSGDMNDDKGVDVIDLVRLRKMSGGISNIAVGADLDGDGIYASVNDLSLTRQYILGAPQVKFGRKLVWSDEFNYSKLDLSKWRYHQTMTTLAEYSDENNLSNTKFKHGNMTLQVNRVDDDTYSAAQGLVTNGNMLFKYGYVEMRAKIPTCEGSWPGFWMMANTSYYDYDALGYFPEIDIFEAFGSNSIKAELHKHFDDRSYTLDAHENNVGSISSGVRWMNLDDEYHLFGFMWDETTMKFYVDGQLYRTINYTNFTGDGTSADGFQVPFYLILNNEILNGQSWAGSEVTSKTETPIEYSIDYIRIYQDMSEGSNEIIYTGAAAQ